MKDAELDQANLRIVVALCAMVYIGVLGFLPGQSVAHYVPVMLYIVVFLLASIVLRQVIARWPGHYPARRV
ncbi:hybrid sensor histidine kinase/response regulator, partial [Pseudomonas shirazensis]